MECLAVLCKLQRPLFHVSDLPVVRLISQQQQDVWMFGVLMVEMLTAGTMPKMVKQSLVAAEITKAREYLQQNKTQAIPKRISNLVNRCFETEKGATAMFSAQQLRQELEMLLSVTS